MLKAEGVLLAVHRIYRGFKEELPEPEIQPAAKLEPRLSDRSSMSEAELFMHCDAARVGYVNPADHAMVVLLLGGGDELLHECKADTLASMIFVDVYGVFDGILVRRPSPKGSVARKAQ